LESASFQWQAKRERFMKTVAQHIPGYSYGTAEVPKSPVSMREFAELQTSTGFTNEEQCCLRLAGEVLRGQARQSVEHWHGIIAGIPNLAWHSRGPEGDPIPEYIAKSNLRFEQWILDSCLRPYDKDWIDYQQQIALRHTSTGKNQVDGVRSTPFVPLRDIIAFVAVMNQTIRPYLAAKGNPVEEVEGMHGAWCKSLQLQLALWAGTYKGRNEW
jgi:hypothetical protein